MLSFLEFRTIGYFTPAIQIFLICVLLLFAIFTQYKEYRRTGKTYGAYPWRISTFLSSIYEEIIFRGFILFGLLSIVPYIFSIVISSALFGIWHLKNYKWLRRPELISQVAYSAFVFGPLACVLTIAVNTIWPAVIVHYVANILADAWRKRRL